MIELPRRGQSRPAYATVDKGTVPAVEVPTREARTIDLFYPLPKEMQDADRLPSFDTIWTVHVGDRLVTQRTPFERMKVEPQRDWRLEAGAVWGPPYWYDPLYPELGFWEAPPVFVERPVVIVPRSFPPPARRVR
jgi:hypothetical protein